MEFILNDKQLRLSVKKEIKEEKIIVNIELYEGDKALRERIVEIKRMNHCCKHCGEEIFHGGERFSIKPNNIIISDEERVILKFTDYCPGGVYSQISIVLETDILPKA